MGRHGAQARRASEPLYTKYNNVNNIRRNCPADPESTQGSQCAILGWYVWECGRPMYKPSVCTLLIYQVATEVLFKKNQKTQSFTHSSQFFQTEWLLSTVSICRFRSWLLLPMRVLRSIRLPMLYPWRMICESISSFERGLWTKSGQARGRSL